MTMHIRQVSSFRQVLSDALEAHDVLAELADAVTSGGDGYSDGYGYSDSDSDSDDEFGDKAQRMLDFVSANKRRVDQCRTQLLTLYKLGRLLMHECGCGGTEFLHGDLAAVQGGLLQMEHERAQRGEHNSQVNEDWLRSLGGLEAVCREVSVPRMSADFDGYYYYRAYQQAYSESDDDDDEDEHEHEEPPQQDVVELHGECLSDDNEPVYAKDASQWTMDSAKPQQEHQHQQSQDDECECIPQSSTKPTWHHHG